MSALDSMTRDFRNHQITYLKINQLLVRMLYSKSKEEPGVLSKEEEVAAIGLKDPKGPIYKKDQKDQKDLTELKGLSCMKRNKDLKKLKRLRDLPNKRGKFNPQLR